MVGEIDRMLNHFYREFMHSIVQFLDTPTDWSLNTRSFELYLHVRDRSGNEANPQK